MFTLQDSKVYDIRYYCVREDQTAINTVPFRYTAGADGLATSADAAFVLNELIGPLYAPLLVDSAEYRGLSIQELGLDPPGVIEYYQDVYLGTVTGDALPSQVCGLITKIPTNLSGFRKGRLYVPFPSESDNTVIGVPGAGYPIRLGSLAADLFAARNIVIGGLQMGLIEPVIYRKSTDTYTLISGYQVRVKWATQRRRGKYGKANASPV